MKLQKQVLSTALLVLLAGCGTTVLDGKKIDYKSAGKVPTLEVPPDLTSPAADNRYVVPDTDPKGSATFSAYSRDRAGQQQAVASELLPVQPKVTLERAGQQRWLLVRAKPEQVWPVVREFWLEMGFIINTEAPDAGLMETDWAENRAKIPQDFIRNSLGKVLDSIYSTAERDKFRTRMERGATPETTEVYISHRGMIEVLRGGDGGDTTIWQPRQADPELEAEMLQRLMLRFGVEESRVKAQIASPAAVERAKLVSAEIGSSLLVLDPFDRAWRRVGLALDRVGFTVVDRDRSKGLYFVRYADPGVDDVKKEKGWLSKLSFWNSEDGKAARLEQYRILVQEQAGNSQVQVQGKDGQVDRSETAGKILKLLHEQLK
jgi:outer membrane protein assembly factor BamC